ncbi:MAG: hypothetical protein CL785_05995 [Chloroflexi bacterium]|nr:hypothetical protein [Chloroflexota bacterium]|tara:strand:+ start:31505 stop:32488 length:984 start_codon:yes stop_codon:yes gene_type:complete
MANNDILVMIDHAEGSLDSTAAEILTAANGLAKQSGGEVLAALCSSDSGSLPQKIISLGASKVYTITSPVFNEINSDSLVKAYEAVIGNTSPKVVLFGRTLIARDTAPRLAFRVNSGFAQDCTSVEIDGDSVVLERPVYGGASVARVTFTGDFGVAVIKAKSYDAAIEDSSRSGEVIDLTDSAGDLTSRINLVDRQKVESEGIRLEDAGIVVSGGRGLGGPEPFDILQELATQLGGALGASRAACDAGWIPYAHQVGLTGKTVSADTYFAIAISGASQHLAGMSAVKNVIAINRDEEANIFKAANFGVVGDWEKVTTAFLNMVKELS